MSSNTTIVFWGSLREDIYIDYDFSSGMMEYEKKLTTYKSVIGGSVYNTSRFLSENSGYNCTMYIWNNDLLERAGKANENLQITPVGDFLEQHPMSIIGVDASGEKRIISCDGNNSTKFDFNKMKQEDGYMFYTSFYEINLLNVETITTIMQSYIDNGRDVMLDLCPLIEYTSEAIVKDTLRSISILSGNKYEYITMIRKLNIQNIKEIFDIFPNIRKIIIKKGEEGAELYDKEAKTVLKTFATKNNAFNTTGCGDVFNAMIIYGICQRMSDEQTLKIAVEKGTTIATGGLPWI